MNSKYLSGCTCTAKRAYQGSASYDLYAAGTKSIKPRDREVITLALAIAIPEDCYGRIAGHLICKTTRYYSSRWKDWFGLSFSPFQSSRRRVHCKERQSYRSIDYWAIIYTKICFSQWVYIERHGEGRYRFWFCRRFLIAYLFFNFLKWIREKKNENRNGRSIRFEAYF